MYVLPRTWMPAQTRGWEKSMRKGEKLKHCKRGHLRTPENLRGNHCKACDREHNKVYDSKPEGKAIHRAHKLSYLGWTVEMWEQTLLEQGNVCASCREPFTEYDKPCADHAHTNPPEPRGILHSSCNKAIGFLQENPEKCRAAAEYLDVWKEAECQN